MKPEWMIPQYKAVQVMACSNKELYLEYRQLRYRALEAWNAVKELRKKAKLSLLTA